MEKDFILIEPALLTSLSKEAAGRTPLSEMMLVLRIAAEQYGVRLKSARGFKIAMRCVLNSVQNN